MTTNKLQQLELLGAASGIAASNPGCGDGPQCIRDSNYQQTLLAHGINPHWQPLFYPEPDYQNLPNTIAVAKWCHRLADKTQQLTEQGRLFGVIGGDHSCAIGTWSGVHQAVHKQGPLGLIWIDAHLDCHTHQTTETGAIHGMPMAALLGYGKSDLTTIQNSLPKLDPKHVCIIGVRSYEKGELEFVKHQGVRVFYIDEIKQYGLDTVMREAKDIVSRDTIGFGISIDLDGVDPKDAPGVGTPENEGISAHNLKRCLTMFAKHQSLLGFEIVEFNPHLDQQRKTERLTYELMIALTMGQEISL